MNTSELPPIEYPSPIRSACCAPALGQHANRVLAVAHDAHVQPLLHALHAHAHVVVLVAARARQQAPEEGRVYSRSSRFMPRLRARRPPKSAKHKHCTEPSGADVHESRCCAITRRNSCDAAPSSSSSSCASSSSSSWPPCSWSCRRAVGAVAVGASTRLFSASTALANTFSICLVLQAKSY